MVWTAFAPSLNSKAGRLVAEGAATGATATLGGGAAEASILGAGALGASAVFGVSTLGSTGFSLGGSGFFSFGTIVTVSCLSFLPRMPSRAAKKTNTETSVA